MENENVLEPYSPLDETRSLFNNQKKSDVRFLVEGQTVFAHKLILSLGSPMFSSMFFGGLKENQDSIEIKDVSLNGFRNALRYIYGFKIDFELSELYDSYQAADKYLLHHFDKALSDYIKHKLNSENSALIYDQLLKIGKEELPLAYVRSMIVINSKVAFESELFKQIHPDTLISLLSLDELKIAEIDLLAAVSKWVDSEVRRQGLDVNRENGRNVFKPIKNYILLTVLTPEAMAHCEEIVELLTLEERGSVVLHKLNKNSPLVVELKTSRRAGCSSDSISVFISNFFSSSGHYYTRSLYLKVNRRVGIQTIYSTYSLKAANLSLQILDLAGVGLDLKMNKVAKDDKWCFSFNLPLDLKPNSEYRLLFTGDGGTEGSDQLSKQLELNYENSTIFNFSPDSVYNNLYHCVRGLDFFTLD